MFKKTWGRENGAPSQAVRADRRTGEDRPLCPPACPGPRHPLECWCIAPMPPALDGCEAMASWPVNKQPPAALERWLRGIVFVAVFVGVVQCEDGCGGCVG